jgi:hypothetical protein
MERVQHLDLPLRPRDEVVDPADVETLVGGCQGS